MADLLSSEAAFKERASECGLDGDGVKALLDQNIKTLSSLAYCLTVPGTSPEEASLRKLLNSNDPTKVDLGSVAAARRLVFEAQTLAVAFVKSSLEGSSEQSKEFVPAERESRIEAQKKRLKGMSLVGQLECGHSCYTLVQELIEANAVLYVDPQKMITRQQEVCKEKRGKEIVLNQDHRLSIRDPVPKETCQISNELQLMQAFTRIPCM